MDFICFDTEDDSKELMEAEKDPFKKQVTQIAAITAEGKRYYNPGDVSAFLKWLERQPEKYVYALNVQYDLGNLFGKKLDQLDVTMVGGRVIKATWGRKVFVDVFNIWPMSVKKLGLAFGLHKLETDSMATDKAYVYRDVEIIREAMLFAWGFCEHLGVSHLPPTLGGLCVKLWKHWGGENCHDSSTLSREAYYGGRVELWKRFDESGCIAYTDINSLYPSVMLKEFPGVLEDWTESKLPKFGIVRVRVRQPKTDLPVLPYRKPDGRIFFPWGTLTGVWTIAEINEALANGATLDKVYECMGTNESMKPYGDFVNNLYAARLNSKSEAEKLFFKLLMNNLYGRLGTSGEIGRSVWQNERNKFEGVPYGEKVLVNYKMPLSDETNWSHAAYVTAYGRIELFRYLRTIGTKALIYCDTDSAIFDCPNPWGLSGLAWKSGIRFPFQQSLPFKTGTELGQMKIESFEPGCEAIAPKMYRNGDKWKAKGVPQRLARQFIETGKAQFDLPYKLREAIRFYDRRNARRLSVWHRVEKKVHSSYDRKHFKNNHFFPCKVTGL